MKRPPFVTLAALALLAAPAGAQDRGLGVDQLTSPAAGRMEQVAPPASTAPRFDTLTQRLNAGPAAAASQISPGSTDPDQPQLSAPGQSAPAPQLSRSDPSARVAAVPPGLRDACAEAAVGRRAPPQGVDCSVVLEAVAVAERPSAEEALLLGDGVTAGRQASTQTGPSQSFDANDVARRLATGDVQNAPLAQAVASGLSAAPPPTPTTPTGPVVITPGRSGGGAPPPQGN